MNNISLNQVLVILKKQCLVSHIRQRALLKVPHSVGMSLNRNLSDAADKL